MANAKPATSHAWRRLAIALVAGVATALLVLAFRLMLKQQTSDFDQIILGARRVLDGQTPYTRTPLPGLEWPIFYPMPALVLGIPLAALPLFAAHAVFSGLSAAIYAWVFSTDGGAKLFAFATWPYVLTTSLGQWGPLLMAASVLPSLAWLTIAKPNIGLALLVAYGPGWARSRRAWWSVVIAVILVGLSFALRPSWVGEWRGVLSQPTPHLLVPLTVLGGPLLLGALLRWRRPEARFLAALAVIPQTFSSYDALLTFLVVRTRREALVLVAATTLVTAVIAYVGVAATYAETVHRFAPLRVALVYVPAVAIVLRRPNRTGPA